MRGNHSVGKVGSASMAATGMLFDNVQFVVEVAHFGAAVRSLHRASIEVGEDEAEGGRRAA